LRSLTINLYDLNSESRATQYQRVETAISSFWKGPKDCIFDVHQSAIMVLEEYSAYEKSMSSLVAQKTLRKRSMKH
jgi:hypothetical protein